MTTQRTIMVALLGFALAATLSACGRKGDLELPEGAKPQPQAASQGPSAAEVLGDNPPVDAEPLDKEMDDIAPRRRVTDY
jgi:predicted small lipoprotein YifL